MQPYLGPPWSNSCQIWCVRVFHLVLLKNDHENAEMKKKKKIWWPHTSVLCCSKLCAQFQRSTTQVSLSFESGCIMNRISSTNQHNLLLPWPPAIFLVFTLATDLVHSLRFPFYLYSRSGLFQQVSVLGAQK